MTTTNPERHPLRAVAASVSKVVGILTALATSLAGYGVITAVQGDAVTGLLGVIPGLITLVGTVFAAFRTASQGERTRLVPAPRASGPLADL